MRRIVVGLSALIVSVAACLSAAEPERLQMKPAKMGQGPLLFFVHSRELHVLDPADGVKPVPVQLGGGSHLRPLERVSNREIVMERRFRGYIADLFTGECTPLHESSDQTELVAVEGNDVFFLRHTKVDPLRGVRLKKGKGGKVVVDNYHRPRDFLYRFVVGAGKKAEAVSPLVIEKLLSVEKDGFWVITADSPQQLARIDRAGKVDKIIGIDVQWLVRDMAHVFSPDRKYLALSVLRRDQDFHRERSLVVCDLLAREVCFTDPSAQIFQLLSYPPPLALAWHDGSVLSYGWWLEGPRWVNVKTRTRLDETAAAKYAANVQPRSDVKRETRGRFELEFGLVYFAGDKTPIASALDDEGVRVRDLAVTADGLFAAYCDPKNNNLYLIDGARRTKTLIMSGWSHDLVWK